MCSPNCLWSGEAITVIYVFCTHFHKKGLFSHKIFITHVKTAQFVTLELSTVLHSHQQPTLYNVSTKDRKGERSTLIDPLKTASKLGCHCAHTYRTWLKTHLKRLQTLKNTLSTYCGSLVIGHIERGAYSIRRTFKSSKNAKLFNASKEFHISDYFHLVIFCGE